MSAKYYTFINIMVLTLLLVSCQESPKANRSLNQIHELSEEAQREFSQKVIRYIGRKPEEASQENKFHAYFDEHYEKEIKSMHLSHYFAHPIDGRVFFVYNRIAPSVQLKKVALGGYVSFNQHGEVKQLKEVFRTWKNIPEHIDSISTILFDKMIDGESLEPYWTKNTNNFDFIEFPSDNVWYDTISFTWKSSLEDPLNEFYEEKIKRTEGRIKEFEQHKLNEQ